MLCRTQDFFWKSMTRVKARRKIMKSGSKSRLKSTENWICLRSSLTKRCFPRNPKIIWRSCGLLIWCAKKSKKKRESKCWRWIRKRQNVKWFRSIAKRELVLIDMIKMLKIKMTNLLAFQIKWSKDCKKAMKSARKLLKLIDRDCRQKLWATLTIKILVWVMCPECQECNFWGKNWLTMTNWTELQSVWTTKTSHLRSCRFTRWCPSNL